jgi:hypothetical protein
LFRQWGDVMIAAELFERMTNYDGGYYFDDPYFQPVDSYETVK